MCREGVNLGFLDKGASSENPGLVFKSGLDLQNLEPSFLLPSKSTGINRAQCQAILCDLFAATVPSLVPLTLVSLSFFITHHGLLTGPLSPLNVAASQERKTLSFSFTFSAPILLPVPPSPTLLTYHLRHVLFLAKAVSSGTWLWMWLPLCPQSSVGLWVCHPPPRASIFSSAKWMTALTTFWWVFNEAGHVKGSEPRETHITPCCRGLKMQKCIYPSGLRPDVNLMCSPARPFQPDVTVLGSCLLIWSLEY